MGRHLKLGLFENGGTADGDKVDLDFFYGAGSCRSARRRFHARVARLPFVWLAGKRFVCRTSQGYRWTQVRSRFMQGKDSL